MNKFKCPHCEQETEIFQSGPQKGWNRLVDTGKVPILAEIPIDPHLAGHSDQGSPVVVVSPQSSTSLHYQDLARKVLNVLRKS